jgi:methylated-DNA-[protein]-cysteine S-methyltransferase
MTARMTKPMPDLGNHHAPLVYALLDTPLGCLRLIARGRYLCDVQGGTQIDQSLSIEAEEIDVQTHPVLAEAAKQLQTYMVGRLERFHLPLMPGLGSPFDQKIWASLRAIPYGQTTTYKAVGEQAGHPKAFRAVGVAVGRNPWLIVVPCHRVLGYNGRLVGFSAGLLLKERLLDLELSHR